MKINPVIIIEKPTHWIPSFTRLIAAATSVCLFLTCASTQAQQAIQWETDIARAQQLAKQQNKLVLLHFTAPWSLSCRNLANFVHAESRVRSAFRENVIAVKIDVDQYPEIVEQYEVPSVPFEVILTADKKVVSKRKSPDNSSAYYKMVTEWAVLLNDANKVSHAINDLQNLKTSPASKFQGKTTSFSPTTPKHLSPSNSPESAELKRRSENPPFAKPNLTDQSPSKPTKDDTTGAESKPFAPEPLGTALPAYQIPDQSSAFSGQNYKKLASKEEQKQSFIQVPTGQVKKNPFFTAPKKQATPLATNANDTNPEKNTELKLPKFKIPTPQPKTPAPESSLAISQTPAPLQTQTPPFDEANKPNNDFRPPNPPMLVERPTKNFLSPKTDSPKPELDNQFKPSKSILKSPAISPKQMLAESGSSLKETPVNKKNPTTTPTYALRGKCPVSLLLQGKWVNGNPQWGCVHRNQVYIFSSELNLKRFKENPEAFSPILAGFDPVVFHETGKLTTGLLNHGVFMGEAPNQRIILFSGAKTRNQFEASPKQYLETVRQAMEQTDSVNRFRR